MDEESHIALEEALGNIGGEESSGSDREPETPPPVVSDSETVLSFTSAGGRFQQLGGPGGEGKKRERKQPVVLLSQFTLGYIVADEGRFQMFRRFLKDQCITRNLNFWLACEHFRQLPGDTPGFHDQLYKVAKALYLKYIKISAPQHVQIQEGTKRAIKSTLTLKPKSLTPSLFAPAQKEVWEMMEQNELRQFLTSDTFRDFFCELDGQSLDIAYTPGALPVRGGGSLQQSSSEDSVSVTSCSTE